MKDLEQKVANLFMDNVALKTKLEGSREVERQQKEEMTHLKERLVQALKAQVKVCVCFYVCASVHACVCVSACMQRVHVSVCDPFLVHGEVRCMVYLLSKVVCDLRVVCHAPYNFNVFVCSCCKGICMYIRT